VLGGHVADTRRYLLSGVSSAIPFVACGGILTATAIDFVSIRADVALKAGLHPVELSYFQRNFVSGLELQIADPGKAMVTVLPERLLHQKSRT
jgi:hypothetical protein